MFTSRAEYRLRLRQDNCDIRLTDKALDIGMACEYRRTAFLSKKSRLAEISKELSQHQRDGIPISQWLKRTENSADKLPGDLRQRYPADLWTMVETDLKYEGYLRREEEQIERQRRQEEERIPRGLDYAAIPSLRLEARQKLRDYAPETLGQASRISGITPADLSVLSVWMRKTCPEPQPSGEEIQDRPGRRGLHGLLDDEEFLQPGEVEELRNLTGQSRKGHPAAARGQVPLGQQENPQPGTAHIRETLSLDDKAPGGSGLLQQGLQPLLEKRGGDRIETTGKRKDGNFSRHAERDVHDGTIVKRTHRTRAALPFPSLFPEKTFPMATTPYDLIVIGGGPAGYVGAIRAAQLGKRVAVVEEERAGGTCLNWGCIPTKALLKNAELYSTLSHHAADFGLTVDGLKYDWEKVIGRSRKVADKLAGGIEFLFKKNKVDYIRGDASVPKAGKVEVKAADGAEQTLHVRRSSSAPAVVAREMPGLPFNGTSVIGSRHALVLPKQPKELIVIGAGAIGVEFAYFFTSFGTKVTIVEMQPNILPVEDTEVSAALEKSLVKQGIRILTGTKVEKATATKEGVKITVSGGASETLSADVALVAIGVCPLLPGGAAPFKLDERGYLAVDDKYETSVPGVYAAGDIIGPPWLAHVASFEAVQAVEGMFGKRKPTTAAHLPRLHLLPAAGRERRPHRACRQGKGPQGQGRQVPFPGQRQGARCRRERRFREAPLQRAARRDRRRAHHRGRCHRDDRRARPCHHARGHLGRHRLHDPRAPHPQRGGVRGDGGRPGPRHPHLIQPQEPVASEPWKIPPTRRSTISITRSSTAPTSTAGATSRAWRSPRR